MAVIGATNQPIDWYEQATRRHRLNEKLSAGPSVCDEIRGIPAMIGFTSSGVGPADSYRVHDYLLQYGRSQRRSSPIPRPIWSLVATHPHPEEESARLVDSAIERMIWWTHQGSAESTFDQQGLAALDTLRRQIPGLEVMPKIRQLDLLRKRAEEGRPIHADRSPVQNMREIVDRGDPIAGTMRLADLLVLAGEFTELQQRASDGDSSAESRLVEVLIARGDFQQLRLLADSKNWMTQERFADLWVARGELGQLRRQIEALEPSTQQGVLPHLFEVLFARGEFTELRNKLSNCTKTKSVAIVRLIEMLVALGEYDELKEEVRKSLDQEDWVAAGWLTTVVGLHGDRLDPEDLRLRADRGDDNAAGRLADVLIARGELQELRKRADRNWILDRRLVGVLIARGELNQLRERADQGSTNAASRLAEVLIGRGELNDLRLRANHDPKSAEYLAKVLIDRGDLDELRLRADEGDSIASSKLAEALFVGQEFDELRDRAERGQQGAGWAACRCLSENSQALPL